MFLDFRKAVKSIKMSKKYCFKIINHFNSKIEQIFFSRKISIGDIESKSHLRRFFFTIVSYCGDGSPF